MNQNFSWGDVKEVGYTSLVDQKNGTRVDVSEGVFNGNAWDSFRTNDDNAMIPQVGSVIGMEPRELVFGEGTHPVAVKDTVCSFTSYMKNGNNYEMVAEGKACIIEVDTTIPKTTVIVTENSVNPSEWVGKKYSVLHTSFTGDYMQLYTTDKPEKETGIYIKVK